MLFVQKHTASNQSCKQKGIYKQTLGLWLKSVIFHESYIQVESFNQWAVMKLAGCWMHLWFIFILLIDYVTLFIVSRGFQIAKTDLVLVELGYAEVPLLLCHLCPCICWLIHSCYFVWIDNKTVKGTALDYMAFVFMCELTKVLRRTNSTKIISSVLTYLCRSWQCRPNCRMHKHSDCTPPGSLLHPRKSHPPRHILQKVTWHTI